MTPLSAGSDPPVVTAAGHADGPGAGTAASTGARAVAVAVSGGRDSLCLLQATLRVARPLGLQVLALHVHHGLLPEADAWERGLRRRCARWARAGWPIDLRVARLAGAPGRGDSVEAWARRGRYRALAEMARAGGASLVLLGHHRRDQAETVLLQALRGAGPAGLAAMPREAVRQGLRWARPWLAQPHEAIDAYARARGLARGAVTDPSNTDPRHDRSRLRRDVLPALRAAFPHAEEALAAVARHAAEARAVLDEVAQGDLAALGAATPGQPLPHAGWAALPPARRLLALRAWLARSVDPAVPETLVRRLASEWRGGSAGAWPAGPGRQLRAWRGGLVAATVAPAPAPAPAPAAVSAPAHVRIDGPGTFALPGWGGVLVVTLADAGGLPARAGGWLLAAGARRGAEQFQRAPGSPPRSLKKQWQAAGVPAWERAGPLLRDGGRLVFVPGLGVDARAAGEPGVPQWQLRWRPAADDGARDPPT